MKQTLLLSALLLTLASCSKNKLNGSGDTVTDTRNVSSFSRIEASGSEEVEILYSSERRVEVSGYRNLVDEFETTVSGNTLRLRYDDDNWNIRNNNIRVRVYTPSLEELSASGSGDVTVLNSGALNLRKAEGSGSGDITIAQPQVANLTLRLTGSGKMLARDASAKEVDAKTTGSGAIEVSVTEELDAEITGSGNIDYWGKPRVNAKVSGSGEVRGH